MTATATMIHMGQAYETGRATRIERLSYSLDDLDLLSSTVSDEEAAAERR